MSEQPDVFEILADVDIAALPERARRAIGALLDRGEILVAYANLRAAAERLRAETVRSDGTVDGQALAAWMGVHDRMAAMCAPA